ncbi:hypothetical protein [Mycolicibacterium agri]|uniref:hypothetical protein n=1 Tax=Mycolicibacterium agri TaxID=36811 RepID=UPI001F1C827E|nr:hypothetical protein [Mycolicibacterium agri]
MASARFTGLTKPVSGAVAEVTYLDKHSVASASGISGKPLLQRAVRDRGLRSRLAVNDDESVTTMAVSVRSLRILLAGACGALFLAAPLVTAGQAAACVSGQFADPFTGQCSGGYGSYPSVNGVPCIPGKHLGTCIGFVQNMPRPGATLGP